MFGSKGHRRSPSALCATAAFVLGAVGLAAGPAGALPVAANWRAGAAVGSCTDSWRGGSGPWTAASDWTAGVPDGNTAVVCITAPGSIVTVDNLDAQINSLVVGSSAGAPAKLVVASNDKTESAVGTWKNSEIGRTGIVDLVSSSDVHTYLASFGSRNGSSLTNDGRITTAGAQAWLEPDLLNQPDGSITFGARLTEDNCCTVTNLGKITLEPGATWDFGGDAFVQAGGAINNYGILRLGVATFKMLGGQETHHPVDLDGSTLVDKAPPGAASFSLSGDDTVAGTIPAGQRVILLAGPNLETVVDLASPGVTNDGTILLEATAAGETDQLGQAHLLNQGTLDIQAAGTGAVISAVVTNARNGKVNVSGFGCTISSGFTNYGALSLGQGSVAQLSGPGFTEGVGSTLGLQIGPGTTRSGFVASGNVPISLAGTLRLTTVGAEARGRAFTVIEDGDTRPTGKFSPVISPGAAYTVSYDLGSVVLTTG